MTTTHDQKWAIGVDVDYYYSVFEGGTAPNAQYLLTSVMKRVDNAVYEAIRAGRRRIQRVLLAESAEEKGTLQQIVDEWMRK